MPKLLHIAALALLLATLVRGETPEAPEPPPLSGNYVMRSWDTADGLPDNNVAGIAQTPDGYMWFATRAGLSRFDGVRFTVFRTKEMPGLQTNIIRTLYVARDGTLWLGLDRGGVSRWAGDHCEIVVPLPPKDSLTRRVCSFAEDGEGAIWIGYGPESRVQRWHRGVLTSFTVAEGLPGGIDTFVHADSELRVWASTRYGLAVFDRTKFSAVDGAQPPFVRLGPARNGGVWVTRGDQLLRYRADGKKEIIADLTPLGGASEVTALFESRDGQILLGTNGLGVCRYRAGRFQRLPTSHSYVLAIGEDLAGNVWVGTQGGGVNVIRPRRFVLRSTKSGIPKESVVSVCTDASGRLWVASRWAPPARAVDAQNKDFAPLENWYARNVTSMCADREGGVWVGHDGGKFARWFQGEVTRPEVEAAERVETLLVDSTGDLWIATIDGPLIRWRENQAELQPSDGGLTRVRALAEDAAGRIWAGTEDGRIFRRENGVFVSIPVPDAKPSQTIRFIVADGSTMWIATRDAGLLRWRAGTFTWWQVDRGLPHDDLRALIVDDSRDLWLATGRGLFRVNRQQLDAVLDGTRSTTRPIFFGPSEGVPGTSFAFETGRNTAARTADQRLWFATARGALEVQAQRQEHDTPPAAVMIEEVRANGALLPLANAIVAPDPRRIEIRFTAPYFGTPERVQFRYRLSGVDDTWINAGSERAATFARLPPGHYRFEVAATDADGDWQPRVATIAFTVRAAWWETLGFRIGASLIAAAALAWLVRIIVKRRMRRRMLAIEQEHALERERIRIARDMHDELGANLTQIGIASQLAKLDPPGVSVHVEEIASIARSTVESLDEIVWAVNPRYDTLASLLEYLGKFAVSFLTSSGIAAKVDIPHNLPSQPLSSNVRHHLFLAVKEALNNVVKHAGASTVWLHAELADGLLRVIVSDDGRGFESGAVQADANGLRNMRERLAEVRGTCRIDGGPTTGTRVICELPLTASEA